MLGGGTTIGLGAVAPDRPVREDLPLVAVFTTGGTMAQKEDAAAGGAVPALSGDDLVSAVPGLDRIARARVSEISNIDSRDMSPEIWLRLAAGIRDAVTDPLVAGVVVVHGTDTMEDTAYFLDRVIPDATPVVVTGAMHHASDPHPDGPANLLAAIRQATDPTSRGRGVTVNVNARIYAARDVYKSDSNNLSAFSSLPYGHLGGVDALGPHWTYAPDRSAPLPLPERLPKVAIINDYPGADGALIDAALAGGIEGLVLVGYGIGNLSRPSFDAMLRARQAGVPVVVASRVREGRLYPVYGGPGGGKAVTDSGAWLGTDISPSKHRILMMLGLAANLDDSAMRRLFADA